MLQDAGPLARPIPGFPKLTELTGGGIAGVWLIGGETGFGKSTVTMNLVNAITGPQMPVFYLNAEYRGLPLKWVKAFGHDAPMVEHGEDFATFRQLDARLNGNDPDADGKTLNPPGIVVIDTVQSAARGLAGADSPAPCRPSLTRSRTC